MVSRFILWTPLLDVEALIEKLDWNRGVFNTDHVSQPRVFNNVYQYTNARKIFLLNLQIMIFITTNPIPMHITKLIFHCLTCFNVVKFRKKCNTSKFSSNFTLFQIGLLWVGNILNSLQIGTQVWQTLLRVTRHQWLVLPYWLTQRQLVWAPFQTTVHWLLAVSIPSLSPSVWIAVYAFGVPVILRPTLYSLLRIEMITLLAATPHLFIPLSLQQQIFPDVLIFGHLTMIMRWGWSSLLIVFK